MRSPIVRVIAAFVFVAVVGSTPSAQLVAPPTWLSKLESTLQLRASGLAALTGQSTVIVRATDASVLGAVVSLIRHVGGSLGRALPIIDGQVARLPNVVLPILAASPLVAHVSLDRVASGALERTASTVGAAGVREALGYDGAGIGVAIIDSGVTPWHDDLGAAAAGQRVARFVDFVGAQSTPYDDYGHGTHVAGIIGGNGYDSGGARAGIAPAADLVALKALDASGTGRISDVIAALGYAVLHKDALNIRVVNLSIAAGVYESFTTDPLALATRAAVTSGIVVVAAAGNNGRSPQGRTHYGGITAPGNAPWVLTVGASSHMGTSARADDTIAAFSSRGPTAIDRTAKPDLVAPGVGIESLSDPSSHFYSTRSAYLLSGTVPTSYLPYLSLSGTSMAAPVVSGTIALMLQARPSLTPNEVKTILQHTADPYAGYDTLTQGAGFLNAGHAVQLARALTTDPSVRLPPSTSWGVATTTMTGQPIVWTVRPADGGDTVVWGTDDGDTVVWGTSCADPSCEPVIWNRP